MSSHAVLSRWKIRRGKEDDFVSAWTRYTDILIEQGGAFGARLHRSEDGAFVSYSWWPSRQAWDFAQTKLPRSAARAIMAAAVEERLPDVHLEVVGEVFMPEEGEEELPAEVEDIVGAAEQHGDTALEDAASSVQYGDSDPADEAPSDEFSDVEDPEDEPDPNAPL